MPRDKKTQAGAEFSDLPDITEQELQFCLSLLKHGNASRAYREAFDVVHWKAGSIQVEASKLRHSPKISLWMNALRQSEASAAQIEYDAWLQLGFECMQQAKESGNMGAAQSYWQKIGESRGFLIHKHEDVTVRDPVDKLKRLARTKPDLAKQLASELGYELPQTDNAETVH